MEKNIRKSKNVSKEKDKDVAEVALMFGKSKRFVQYVIKGERKNEQILAAYKQLKFGKALVSKMVEENIKTA